MDAHCAHHLLVGGPAPAGRRTGEPGVKSAQGGTFSSPLLGEVAGGGGASEVTIPQPGPLASFLQPTPASPPSEQTPGATGAKWCLRTPSARLPQAPSLVCSSLPPAAPGPPGTAHLGWQLQLVLLQPTPSLRQGGARLACLSEPSPPLGTATCTCHPGLALFTLPCTQALLTHAPPGPSAATTPSGRGHVDGLQDTPVVCAQEYPVVNAQHQQ